MVEIVYYPFTLKLISKFTLASGSRETTPAVLLEVNFQNRTGLGEASLPPYLGISQQQVLNVFRNLERLNFTSPDELDDYFVSSAQILKIPPAAAALDIALCDLRAKISDQPVFKILDLPEPNPVQTSYTITFDTEEIVKRNIERAGEYKILKIKLGTVNDDEFIRMIRRHSDKPFYADVNQGWKNFDEAVIKTEKLAAEGALLIEQPLPKEMVEETIRLRKRSPIPVIADESVQNLEELDKAAKAFDGINVKLMKCGGIRNAIKLIKAAKEMDMKIMLGCMTETSCSISAAFHLSSLAEYHDLDGALLVSNDPFGGIQYKKGKISVRKVAGLGIGKIANI